MKVHEKKEKKVGHMKVHEKKETRKKDSHVLKRIYERRETTQKEFPSTTYHHYIHTRAHLDLIV